MSEYTPDCWVIVEFSGTKVPKTYHRVLAGWYGGYAGSDSWKLSSGFDDFKDMIDRGDHWEIHNTSGSVYICYKQCERFSNLTASIFASYASDNTEEVAMTNISFWKE